MKVAAFLSTAASILLVGLGTSSMAQAGLNSSGTEWTVESGDTLYNIARRLAPKSGKQQAAIRRHMQNNSPKAFRSGNVNSLEIGDVLSVPQGYGSQQTAQSKPKPRRVKPRPVKPVAAPVVVPKPRVSTPKPKPVVAQPAPRPAPVVAEPAPAPVVTAPSGSSGDSTKNPYVTCKTLSQKQPRCNYWRTASGR